MTPNLIVLLSCVAAYLLGAIPFGFLVARTKGVDIRTVGSGNIGATNVWRFFGKKWGALVYLLDMAKGFVAAALIPALTAQVCQVETSPQLALVTGLLAVAGHNWPVYLKFKGGKGIATTAGVLLGVAPAAMGIGIGLWLITFLTSRYVSLASILAAVSVGASGWFLYESNLLCCALTVLGAFAAWRHQGNIRRLLSGTEHRFNLWKKK